MGTPSHAAGILRSDGWRQCRRAQLEISCIMVTDENAPLPLDSPRWSELAHVYGSAVDMPVAIRRLERLDHIEAHCDGPLVEITSAIYHQGDPDTGSYATVPHLVRIAESRPPGERLPLLSLCGWIEQYRTSRRPRIPEDLEPAYRDALARALTMTIELLAVPRSSWGPFGDPYDLHHIFMSIAALSGERKLAFLIDHIDDLEFYLKQENPEDWPPWPE